MHLSNWLTSLPLLSPVLPVAVNISTQRVFLQQTLHQSEGYQALALCGSVMGEGREEEEGRGRGERGRGEEEGRGGGKRGRGEEEGRQ